MKKLFITILFVALAYLLSAILTALPVMWLWNWLVPDIFGLQSIDFWQALGLSLLARVLFGTGSSSSSSK